MITKIELTNFKSHKNTALEMSNLNILTGENSVGKSSILQAMLLLRQTFFKHNKFENVLDLNGELYEIGTAQDLYYKFAGGEDLMILFKEEDKELVWKYNPKGYEGKTYMPCLECPHFDFDKISLFNNDFQYISAFRDASNRRDDVQVEQKRQVSLNKGKGELTAQFLHTFGEEKIDESICGELSILDDANNSLIKQVVFWENYISENVTVLPQKNEFGFNISYGYKDIKSDRKISGLSSNNIGFGVSNVLPIMVALLSAKKGSLIFIENPEAHLHPEAQARIAQLMCLVSQAGVQVVVETHSDHIINGILVACKKFENKEKGIDKKKVRIHHMYGKDDNYATQVEQVIVGNGGSLEYQPSGFFDKITKDNLYLMGYDK